MNWLVVDLLPFVVSGRALLYRSIDLIGWMCRVQIAFLLPLIDAVSCAIAKRNFALKLLLLVPQSESDTHHSLAVARTYNCGEMARELVERATVFLRPNEMWVVRSVCVAICVCLQGDTLASFFHLFVQHSQPTNQPTQAKKKKGNIFNTPSCSLKGEDSLPKTSWLCFAFTCLCWFC